MSRPLPEVPYNETELDNHEEASERQNKINKTHGNPHGRGKLIVGSDNLKRTIIPENEQKPPDHQRMKSRNAFLQPGTETLNNEVDPKVAVVSDGDGGTQKGPPDE